MKLRSILAMPLAGLLAAGAALAAQEAAPAQATEPVPAATVLPDLKQAQSLAIDDVWNGFNRIAPIEAHYALQRAGDGFRGKADFSAGRNFPGGPTRASADIAIPQAVVDKFCGALAQAPLREGAYAPRRGHTDDYPDLTITIAVGGQDVVFASQSQGKERKPWHVVIGGRDYVSDSGQAAAALDLLKPYLKRDVLDGIVEKLKR